jgi:hypothetical protein
MNFFGFNTEEEARFETTPFLFKRYNEDLHIVSSTYIDQYLSSNDMTVNRQRVLWVSLDNEEPHFDDWCEWFDACFLEEKDFANLANCCMCEYFLRWHYGVICAIPPKWFSDLIISPKDLGIDDLPITDEDKKHLKICTVCSTEFYNRLQVESEIRRNMFCPKVGETNI